MAGRRLTAEEILAQRFARGEISEEEYDRLLRKLTSPPLNAGNTKSTHIEERPKEELPTASRLNQITATESRVTPTWVNNGVFSAYGLTVPVGEIRKFAIGITTLGIVVFIVGICLGVLGFCLRVTAGDEDVALKLLGTFLVFGVCGGLCGVAIRNLRKLVITTNHRTFVLKGKLSELKRMMVELRRASV